MILLIVFKRLEPILFFNHIDGRLCRTEYLIISISVMSNARRCRIWNRIWDEVQPVDGIKSRREHRSSVVEVDVALTNECGKKQERWNHDKNIERVLTGSCRREIVESVELYLPDVDWEENRTQRYSDKL